MSARGRASRPVSSIAPRAARPGTRVPAQPRAPVPIPAEQRLTRTRPSSHVAPLAADSRFTQQQLPAWRPTLTPAAVRTRPESPARSIPPARA